MADKRIDAHTNTTTVANVDEFIVDSGANGTRNITYSDLKAQLLGTTSIAAIGNTVTEAIYNVHMDQAVPKIDTTTGVMYLEGGAAFEGNIDSTPTAGSNNAVSSGGTKTYVDNAVSQLNAEIDGKVKKLPAQTIQYTSTSTNLEYTGVNVSCPTGHTYIVRAKCDWDNAYTQSIAASDSNTDVSTWRRFAYGDSAYISFILNAGETAYIWGKWSAASKNRVHLSITDITL